MDDISVSVASQYSKKDDSVMKKGDEEHERNFLNSFVDGTPKVICAWMKCLEKWFPTSMCTPFRDTGGSHSMWFDNGELKYLPGLAESVMRRRCSSKRFSGWIIVFRTGSGEIHANAVLYDRKRGELTRYEPRGSVKTSYDHEPIDEALREFAMTKLGASSYNAPHTHQLRIGVQTKEVIDAAKGVASLPCNGPCVMWSLFFIHMQLLHPDMRPSDISKRIESDECSPTAVIQAYAHFMEESREVRHGVTSTDRRKGVSADAALESKYVDKK